MAVHSEFYERYMKSPQWENKKRERREIDGNRCVMCGRPSEKCKRMALQCHHITYERLGKENVFTDLVTLCGSCHSKIHNLLRRRTA